MPGRALAVVALLLAFAVGCGGASAPPAAQIVARSAAKTSALRSFHLLVHVENVPASTTGVSLTYVDGDLAVPDRLRAKIAGTLQGVPLTSELIVVGDRHFLKNPFTGKWETVSIGMKAVTFFDPAKGVLAVIRHASGLERDGSEDVGGVACYRLQGKVRADAVAPLLGNPGSAAMVPVELWIGKRDSLLRRIRLSGPLSAGEPAGAVRTVELSAFDEPVQVAAPAVG
ncbi:MAG: LppX_LprAFG lipoprotein [Gaiellaceae bacterium]